MVIDCREYIYDGIYPKTRSVVSDLINRFRNGELTQNLTKNKFLLYKFIFDKLYNDIIFKNWDNFNFPTSLGYVATLPYGRYITTDDLINNFCSSYNLIYNEAIIIVLNAIGIKHENMFKRYSKEEKPIYYPVLDYINNPIKINYNNTNEEDKSIEYWGCIDIKETNGTIVQFMHKYNINGELVSIFADRYNICGYNRLEYIFPGINYITKHTKYIIFSLNPDVTFILSKIAISIKLAKSEDIVISGFTGGEPKPNDNDFNNILNLSKLYLSNLIIVVSPLQDEWWIYLDKFINLCDKYLIKVKVYPYMIKYNQHCGYDEKHLNKLSTNGKCVVKEHVYDIERLRYEGINSLILEIQQKSKDLRELELFKKAIEINNNYDVTCSNDENISIKTVDIYGDYYSYSKDIAELIIIDLINNKFKTLIYGGSNTGKSYFCIKLGLSLATGKEFLFLNKSEPVKVAYLDGELGDTIRERVRQLSTNSDKNMIIDNFIICNCTNNQSNFADEKIKDKYIEMFINNKIKVVIIDNITRLFHDVIHGNIKSYQRFTGLLMQNDISVITVAHSDKKCTGSKGSNDIESLSQNIIVLKSEDYIEKEFNNNIPNKLKDVINSNFCKAIKVEFIKCKACMELEHKDIYLKLEKNKDFEIIDIDEDKDEQYSEDTSDIVYESKNIYNDAINSLKPKEQKVLSYISNDQNNLDGCLTNNIVQEITELKDRAALNILKVLTEKGFLERQGGGRNASYVLTSEYRSFLTHNRRKSNG